MPASRYRPRYHHVFSLVAVMLFVCVRADAQRGSVKLTASVSETVALSIAPFNTPGNIASDVVRSGNTVRLTLSSTSAGSPDIRVPLLVRSNSDFKISASFESQTAVLNELSVIDVRATGTLISPQAVSALDVVRSNPPDPLLVLSGPRVSLGGTLESPNNALQVNLLIRLQPQQGRGWSLQLTFVATPE